MDWLEGTDFGYYVLCPAGRVREWDGTEAHTELEEYINKILLPGDGEVLTIGGEALPVTCLPGSLTFVQNVGSDESVDLHREVERAMAAPGWQDAVEIVLGGQYALIDAMVPGADTEDDYMLRIDIPHGRYRVQSVYIERPLGEFHLHRLQAVRPRANAHRCGPCAAPGGPCAAPGGPCAAPGGSACISRWGGTARHIRPSAHPTRHGRCRTSLGGGRPTPARKGRLPWRVPFVRPAAGERAPRSP
ncbi:Imm21 family immunity protein [Streptomyces sp. NPDC090445]|uniref:Imm21 family immunity protein n=1 Tax=Streptomyces sp. NPDC090445 TaxID=3365963 RepID=UPI0037F3961F